MKDEPKPKRRKQKRAAKRWAREWSVMKRKTGELLKRDADGLRIQFNTRREARSECLRGEVPVRVTLTWKV